MRLNNLGRQEPIKATQWRSSESESLTYGINYLCEWKGAAIKVSQRSLERRQDDGKLGMSEEKRVSIYCCQSCNVGGYGNPNSVIQF